MIRIDLSLTDGVDQFHVQPSSTPPNKHPMEKRLSGLMIRKESALGRKGKCFSLRDKRKNLLPF